jgi:VanZ family protein
MNRKIQAHAFPENFDGVSVMKFILKIWRPLCYLQFTVMLVIYTVLGLTRNTADMVPAYNDLVMHFTGYVIAGISISFAWPRTNYWQRALFLLMYSIAIEIGQHFLPPRTFSWLDILANLSGVIVGLLLFVLLKKISPQWANPLVN